MGAYGSGDCLALYQHLAEKHSFRVPEPAQSQAWFVFHVNLAVAEADEPAAHGLVAHTSLAQCSADGVASFRRFGAARPLIIDDTASWVGIDNGHCSSLHGIWWVNMNFPRKLRERSTIFLNRLDLPRSEQELLIFFGKIRQDFWDNLIFG